MGSVQRQPELAETLEAIGREGPAAFYYGPIAEDMVAYLRSLGGLHTADDFARAEGEYVKPITTEYRGRTIYECPPNGQGVVALTILNILSRFKAKPDPLDIDNLHVEIEATRLAYAARDAFLGDPGLAEVPVDYLLSDRLADELAAKIDLSHAIEYLPSFAGAEHKDTVYIAVVDEERNAVSFINSLFNTYGSGLMSPKSGVMFQNRGQGFVLRRGPNEIAPGKRPIHTIIPGMAGENGRVFMPFGVMGGRIRRWATRICSLSSSTMGSTCKAQSTCRGCSPCRARTSLKWKNACAISTETRSKRAASCSPACLGDRRRAGDRNRLGARDAAWRLGPAQRRLRARLLNRPRAEADAS